MIHIQDLQKHFHGRESDIHAVNDVSLQVEKGEIFGIIGYSGAGKSTLVRCINFLEYPDSGSIEIKGFGKVISENGQLYRETDNGRIRLKEKDLRTLRRSVGMIFQLFNLLDRSTVFDNIAYPLRYTGMNRTDIRSRVMELLRLVGLTDKAAAYPSQLSGGQKQRVAIARALAGNPKILLSDEATSALDPDATESILNLLRTLNEELGLTIVLITHEMAVIKAIAHRVAVMENGLVVEEGDVYDVFANPQQDITRRFVASATALSRVDKLLRENSPLVQVQPGEMLLRLTFSRESVGDAAISTISRDYGVSVNIVLASVEALRDDTLGGLIAVFKGTPEQMEGAVNWLEENKVKVEVLRRG